MSRKLLVRLAARLAVSSLPPLDGTRLELESELLALMTAHVAVKPRPFVLVIHEDARGDWDTAIPN